MSRRPSPPGRARPDGSNRWMIPALLLLVVVPVGLAVSATFDNVRSNRRPTLSRAGSKQVAPIGAKRLAMGSPLESYSLTYRLERYDRHAIVVSSDRIDAQRPYNGRVLSTISGKQTGLRASRFGTLVITTGTGARSLVSPPSPPTADVRPDIVIGEVPDRVFRAREQREVLGRRCQVYRAGSTVSAGILKADDPTSSEHADVCVDGRGLVLEEVWYKNGRPLQRRIATRVDEDPNLDDDLFALQNEKPLTAEEGNGIFQPIDPTTGFEGTMYRLPSAPAGFDYEGRFLVQPPRLSLTNSASATDLPPEQVSLVDTWTRGPDLLVLTQTIAASFAALPPTGGTSSRVDLGALGQADAIFDLRMNEVRVELPEARFVRLTGTLPRSALVDLAKTLQSEQGTGPRIL